MYSWHVISIRNDGPNLMVSEMKLKNSIAQYNIYDTHIRGWSFMESRGGLVYYCIETRRSTWYIFFFYFYLTTQVRNNNL